jgi:hypothetical protein
MKKGPLSGSRTPRILALLADGVAPKEIARLCGVTHQSVSAAATRHIPDQSRELKAARVAARKSATRAKWQPLLDRYARGDDPKDIASDVGANVHRLRSVASRFNVRPPAAAKAARRAAASRGKVRSPETREKIAASKRGKPRPPHVMAALHAGRAKWRDAQRCKTRQVQP